MPCRKENYILLEQSVTVDSKEVDALVSRIGEALQLHNNGVVGVGQKTVSVSVSCLHGAVKPASLGLPLQPPPLPLPQALPKRHGCCMRLRNRGGSRASPYSLPGTASEADWDHIKPWNKKRIDHDDDDDPHRLLQDLILSGNLIKEAVRRLHFSAADSGTPTQQTACHRTGGSVLNLDSDACGGWTTTTLSG